MITLKTNEMGISVFYYLKNLILTVFLFFISNTLCVAQELTNTAVNENLLNKRQWLYFGWEEDHPKAISLMGGAVYPRRPRLPENDDHSWEYSRTPWHKNSSDIVLFMLSVDNSTPYYPDENNIYRRKIIDWSIAENYLPFPISQWEKDHIKVRISHVGRQLLKNSVNAVYTQVILTNTNKISHQIKLVISGNNVAERVFSTQELTLNKTNVHLMEIPATIPAGKNLTYEFVLPANGHAEIQSILDEGGFSKQYLNAKAEIDQRINKLTKPVSLPYDELIYLWKSSMPNMWNATVKTSEDYEQRGSGGNVYGFYQYDRVFDHDVPDMAIQYILEGDWNVARQIMEGATYKRLSEGLLSEEKYNDAIPKYLITMAQYLQTSGDTTYFSKELFKKIKNCAHAVHDMRKDQLSPDMQHFKAYGLIQKGGTLDNGNEYLVVDNFAALHGFTAYKYICDRLGETDESTWAKTELEDLNSCLNKAIDISMKEQGVEWYNACFSFDYDSLLVSGPGNWFGTTLMMSSFPWNASLKGLNLGGTWKDHFDASVEKWIQQAKSFGCENGSFGAWWNAKYGSIYNAGMGLQLLYSDKYRTLVPLSIEWLLDNQSSPYHWGESFHKPTPASDWTLPEVDLETWGLGFIRQALLQLCVSVNIDGTIILGRGIPDHWLSSGRAISWENVYINNGKKIDFSLKQDGNKIIIKISGDDAEGDIIVDLPVLKGKKVIKPGNIKEIIIEI